jgi:hypothetical protein
MSIGDPEQRDVAGMLEVGLADDSSVTVAGALIVDGVEPLDAEDTDPAGGQLGRCRRAHAAEPDHDDVVVCHGRILRWEDDPDGAVTS